MRGAKILAEHRVVGRGRRLVVRPQVAATQADGLDTGKLEQSRGAARHAVAALAAATERQARIGRRDDQIVDRDRTGADADRQSPRRLLRPEHRGAQGIRAPLVEAQRLFAVAHRDEREYRSKDIGLEQGKLRRRVRNQDRAHGWDGRRRGRAHDPTPGTPRLIEQRVEAFPCRRSDRNRRQAGEARTEPALELGRLRLRHEDAARRDACRAAVQP